MLKIKDGYILSQVAGQNIVIPSGDELNLNQMITLNGTGRFLWEHMQQETTEEALTAALLEEYEVDEKTSKHSVEVFVEKLRKNELLD